MDKNSKIVGFYSYTDYIGKDNEPKKVYVYVSKDKETGKLSYHMTNEDSDEYKVAFAKYCKDNGYNKKNQDRIFTDNRNKANINCKSPEQVFNLIRKANKNNEVDAKEYNDVVDSYYKETTKRNIINTIKGFKELPKKGLYFIKKHPKITVAATCLALIVSGGIFKLATNKGPTANQSRIVSNIDTNNDDLNINNTDKTNNEENKDEVKEEETVTETKAEEDKNVNAPTTTETYTATPTTYRSNGNSSSTNKTNSSSSNNSHSIGSSTSNSSNGNTSSGSTSGGNNNSSVTDSNLPGFQDPNASIDNSNDQNTGNENTEEDNKYDNVISEEEPDNSNTNTGDSNNSDNNNSNDNTEDNTNDNSNNDTSDTIEEEVPVEDENYSEEIEVPAVSDDNENSNDINNDANNGDTSTDIKEDEELTTDNTTLDPSIPEGAIDSDLSYEYEEVYDNESGNLDQVINTEPLPDPNETATGDYVTDENEWYFANDNSNTTTQSTATATENVDVVPVEQTSETTTTSTTSNYDSNVAAVDKVIEELSNGNANVNLVYNQDGSLSVGYTENTPTAEAEASSMIK